MEFPMPAPAPGPDSILLEDFGQKVDLTRRIREVLLNYPEGTTVLKELIQNADDAGATKVCLCLDRRVHGSESLLSEKLAQWQGPALLAYNNAEFTEEDFVSISRIGGSNKHGQAWKTGRFGVGFNSVYHLTDLPSFVSGKYVVLFDPQGVYLPNVSTANPGKRIEYVSSSAISLYKDQFLPYCAFGCDMKHPFSGTLFRFPLRNADQAAISKLSRQAYLEDDISSMFVQLYEEGVFALLFLKSVLSIEMYTWDAGEPDPRKIYSCTVSSANDDTVLHRQALLRLSKTISSLKSEMDAFSLDFLSEAIIGNHLEKRIDTFYIVQKMASASSKIGSFAATASKEYDIHLLPWASVAACVSNDSSNDNVLKLGRAFCFLPLPVRTGMTVQVNGYFEVSSNRRGIWYGDDMDRSGKIRSMWNRLLLEEVVAPSFIQLLLGVQRLLGPEKLYYSLWPSGSFEEPWSLLVEHIYRNIGNAPVLYSELEGGKWVAPIEAFLHDEEFNKTKELSEALVQLGMPIVHLSNPVSAMLLKYASGFQQKEEILSRYYGIERMGKTLFYRLHVLNRVRELQPVVRDSIMLSVLQDLPQLCVEDTSFRECLRNLEFVPTHGGAVRCPSMLYDPRNEELYALLEDSDCFPCGVFEEAGVLDMLQGLGLRTSISPETVIRSARQVEQLMCVDQQKAYSRGEVLLSYLEVNAMKPRNVKSDIEKFWNDLRMICWCPVLVSAPYETIPWPVVSSMVAPPKLVRLQTDFAIAAQLLELGKNNEVVNDQVLRQELALAMPRIYSILMGMIGSDEMDIVRAVLEGCRWIWVGDGFATADEVVLDGPLHLAPYIRVIPVDLAVFKELFLKLGIREFVKPDDYANILGIMFTRKGSTPLDAQEIRAALLIVQHLAEVQFHEHKAKIYLPDVSGRLLPVKKLGVCSLRRTLLAENGPGILFELVQNAEDAGASEVIFLLDKTQYGTSSILSPEMADWQGPALYCFNDSVFSPQDLYAISRIDIPTFVSGENIVMFDPHACNLPGISPSHPGLRIRYVGRRILEQFPDQFSPFLHFGCDLQNPFPGTLFRFPLRSASVASRSQIKKEGYAPEDVMSLFASFSEVVSEALLFVRNVKTISIFVKEETGCEMQLIHRIVMTEQSSSKNMSHFWITSECLGVGQVKNSAPSKSHNLIPWACVAAYLHSVKNFEGRAFCFLPLPISTGLPAHVNAYFELSSNRRDIWFGNDMAGGGKKRSEWNIYLLEDVAAPAYGHLLEKIALELGPCDLFFSFWPTSIGIEPWASMVQKLYNFIADSGLSVLYTKARGGQWISAKQAVFPDFTFSKAHELVEVLSDAGLPLVSLSKPLVERFMENAMILTLEYCLLDLKMPVRSDSLYGLPLVPLANGLFTAFDKMGVGERIYIARGDEYGLLKDSIPHQLVDSGIPEGIHMKLCDIAQTEDLNISFLTCYLLEKLFLRLLPAEWQHAKQVIWNPGHQGQPSLEWLRLLWSYLKSCCDDLSEFSKWPILPVGNNYLLKLVENSNVIKDDGWSENMCSLLLKVGCLFLRNDLPIEHPQLKNYVQLPTATGILNALLALARNPENVQKLFCDASEGELHELRSFILQSKWFSEGQMDDTHIDVIKHLPMFESFRSRKLVCLSKPTKLLKPNGVSEDLLNDDFVRTDSEKERIILRRYLEVKEPSRAEFYKDYVVTCMPEFLSQQGALSAILHDVKLLIEEDTSIKLTLSITPFVLAANGSWQQPSRLYDPRVPELQDMLHREVFFPSDKFSDPETLETLVSLGLRQSLGFTGLLDFARSVSIFHDLRDSKTLAQGRRLLTCLDAVALKLSTENGEGDCNRCENATLGNLIDDKLEEEFWSEMKAIAWCPIFSEPPIQGLPWLISSNQVAAPSMVRPKSQMWMVSAAMHLLDGEFSSIYLQRKLGWMDQLDTDVLSTQLIELSKSYSQLKLQSVVKPVFDAELQKGIPSLYSKLQEYVGTDDFMVLKSALDGIPWVWIGDDFVYPNALAFDSPVKFTPCLYVVPSELSEFRDLLLALGVKLSFDILDYFLVLQRLQNDVKGFPLTTDQLSFVHCILEAVADCCSDKPLFEASNTPLLLPDSSGVLICAGDLVYNDAPWMENNALVGKHFVHPSISNDLANRLGVQSLRCLSLVDEEMTKDLPCMDYGKISELLVSYGDRDFLLFDLLELADCCKAKKLHLIFDKREHPRQSLLQHNLGEFQGPALVAIMEGASLSREEVSSLQLLPPWRLRGDTLNYGLGLLSCYSISDLPSIVSGGYFYIFDPHGLALPGSSSHGPTAKVFSLIGTNLTERFCDQFNPMLIGQNMPWSSSDCTVMRMPLSTECMKGGLEFGLQRVKQIFDRFLEHASRVLLSLKSVLQVSLSTWEEGNPQPSQDYSVGVDSSAAIIRNPFSEKKWRKFQISRLFSSSNAAIKLHVIDVNMYQGRTRVVDRWLIVLSLGSGQTRNMALDRRYLAYNLTPVAGVAAHISRNGHPADSYLSNSNSIMCPLPLSSDINMPVTVLGCFLVRHNGGRYLFKCQDREAAVEARPDAGNLLIEAWNRELMSCVRDSYIEMVLEIQKLRREPSSSTIEPTVGHTINLALKAYGDRIYSFWPRSTGNSLVNEPSDGSNLISTNVLKADWECLIEHVIRPFYARLVDLPVWQLYSGNLVKAEEGMFLSQPRMGLVNAANSGGDALEMVTTIGKALFDFGRGVVEDIGRGGGPLVHRNSITGSSGDIRGRSEDQKLLSIAAELRGLPCPTATMHLTRLGVTELWIGNKEQQTLMIPLAAKFIHSDVLDRSILADIFCNPVLQTLLKLQNFSVRLLSNHMRKLFHESWVNHIMDSNMAPWFSWENTTGSSQEGGPSPEWIRLFWNGFSGSLEDLSLFSDWPLIPAFLGRPILCRVRECQLVFIPPPTIDHVVEMSATEIDPTGISINHSSETESLQSYISAFKAAENKYPWLLSLLNQCNIPIFDAAFMECAARCNCLPTLDQSLGQIIACKLVAAKQAGYFPELNSFLASERDELFALFASDFSSNGSKYGREELEVLRALPIYKTVTGSYTQLQSQDLCMIPSSSFLKPCDERCLSYPTDSVESSLLRALAVPELQDQQILARFVRNSDEFSIDLSKPKDLFDPGDVLLTSVFFGERKKFPGERFTTDGWLRILRKTGLRTAAEADVILECARRVEFLGSECMKPRGDLDDFESDLSTSQNEISLEIWSLAGSVVESVFSNFAVLYSNNFCNLLGKIAFVPTERGFPSVGGKKGGKRVLSSYSEVVLLKDWPLAWSCAPILSKQNVVPPEYSWGAFHLRSPPVFSTVIKHLQIIGRNGGEDTLAHWPTASGMMTIDEASCEVLKYLDKVWGSLSSSDKAELQKVAFIPAANGTRLVTAKSLFVRLAINLSPFAFELPTLYLPFVNILKDMGLQDMLSVTCAKDLLLNLQKACGYQRLNPNELRAVMEILYFICDTEANISDGSNWESEAIVPDDGCRLVHAKSCVYIDSYGSRYVKYIDISRLRFVHPDLPERICTELSIKKLSDVVIEELNHGEHLQTVECIRSVPLASIRQKLLSRSLQAAVWTVINSVSSYMPASNHLTLEKTQSSLEYVAEKLQFVHCLHTHFLLHPKLLDITSAAKESIPEWKNEFQHRTLYFINRSRTCFFIAEPPAYISVYDVIAAVVSHVLGSPTPLPIGSLFQCPDGSETAVVNILKLCSDKRETEPMDGSSSLVGKEILPQDALHVQLHPLRPFYRGEIVAWQSRNGDKLKYGRVPEDVRPSSGQALYRFKVETAPGVTETLLSSQVFSFRSISMDNQASSSATLLESNSTVIENRMHTDMPESSGRGRTRYDQLPPGKELQYGRVSAAELVQAVHEMLCSAGINMDVEKQSLLQTTLTLQEQLKESQAALLLEQEKADMAAKEADTAKASWMCRVCLSAEVDITIIPCGHVLCRRCSSAVSRCPFCRLQVSKTMKIYRP
ncbi:unnamed protein product, partial [Vitis vinifera]